jgi:hypothetical protein
MHQRAIIMEHLPANSKKEYPVTYRALKTRGNRFVQGSVTSLTKFLNVFKKEKEVNVQNINGIISDLRDVFKYHGATTMIT